MAATVPAEARITLAEVPATLRVCALHPQAPLQERGQVLVCPDCEAERGQPAGRYFPRRCPVCQTVHLAHTMNGFLCRPACQEVWRNRRRRERYATRQGGLQ